MAPCHLTGTKSIRNNVTSVGQTHTHTQPHIQTDHPHPLLQ